MRLRNEGAQIYVPDGVAVEEALARTTHMAVGAHQDDVPIMAFHGILECFGRSDKWFLAVTVTDGSGSPRDDLYADYTDEQMRAVRAEEEKKAAMVGEYSAAVLMDYPSSAVKDPANLSVKEELKALIEAAGPSVIYVHNLADKHDTHVATALRTIAALRELPAEKRPQALYGCEVWRDLDWMIDEDKVAFDVSSHENLAAALMGIYDSQICGGKRYDLATAGRRKAHATYHATHGVDVAQAIIFAMDLTPLMADAAKDPWEYVQEHINRFAADVKERITKLT